MSEEIEFEAWNEREALLDKFAENCPGLGPELLEQVNDLLANTNTSTEELEEYLSVLAQKMDKAAVAYSKLADAYDEIYCTLAGVEEEVERLLYGEEGSL